jgi:hypothetical protein
MYWAIEGASVNSAGVSDSLPSEQPVAASASQTRYSCHVINRGCPKRYIMVDGAVGVLMRYVAACQIRGL